MRKLNVFTRCKFAITITIMAAFYLTIMPSSVLCASDTGVENYPSIESNTESANNMSFVFDLALQKRLVGTSTPRIGDVVQFEITIINEGDHYAAGYTISDDISDGFEFLPALNPGWTLNGNMISYTETNYLVGGESRSYIVSLKLLYGNQYDYENIAEISDATDNFGDHDSDIDSSPDDDMSNDPQGEDDIDQDFVKIFDLALVNFIDCPNPNKTFKAGQEVCFTMKVYNQGNIPATDVSIINYSLSELDFDPIKNPDWTFNGNGYVYNNFPKLAPGQAEAAVICYQISEHFTDGKIINHAEIIGGENVDCPGAQDYDSYPDQIFNNDPGGEVLTFNDNNNTGNGIDDEDDHDPALITVTHVDLALKKVIEHTLVRPGEIATFDIVIYNQGTEAVNSVTIVDYLPENTTLVDDSWHDYTADPTGQTVYQEFVFPSGLLAGESFTTSIELRLDSDIEPMILVNYAEIEQVMDMYNQNVSSLDIDSSPDGTNGNDNGGVANSTTDNQIDNDGGVDEDDHDPAQIYFLNATASGAQCRMDADVGQAGLFDQTVTVTAPAGQNWTVDNAVNFYDISSTNSNALVPFAQGTALTPGMSLPGGMQEYVLTGSHVDGDEFHLRFVNENLDYDEHWDAGSTYEKPVVTSDLSFAVCETAEATYTVPPIIGCTIAWEVTDGVSPSPIATGSGESFTHVWAASGTYQVVARYTCGMECVAPAVATVQVGNTGGQIQCINDLNISLGDDCSAVVTPAMIIAGTPLPGASYAVMLTWPDGTPIPNATLTEDHLWHDVIAKLIDGCTGNACWATLHVEEKVAPTIDCSDTEQFCYKMHDYLPYATDNCTAVSIEQIGEVVEEEVCDPTYIKTIWRTYKSVDDYGNESAPCTQKINVLRFPLDDIVPPSHFGGIEPMAMDPIECDEIEYDENNRPSIAMTGVPTIEGMPLYPLSDDIYCKIGVSFSDYEVDTYDCGKKFMRTWTVYEDYCPTDPTSIWTFTQTIEIVDTKDPEIEAPANITVYSSLPGCEANVTLPAAVVSDNCSEPVVVNIAYGFGDVLQGQNGGNVVMPFGTHMVEYTALDQCNNKRTVSMFVTVEDGQGPTAICDGIMTVGLRQDGTAEMYAPMFDEGSTDNCLIDFMKVRRVDTDCPNENGDETEWSDFVSFCCADVGSVVTVEFAVWDAQGLMSSICESEVTVQDKFGPEITPPADLTFNCDEVYDIDAILAIAEPVVFDECSGTDYTFEVLDGTYDDLCGEGVFMVEYTATDGTNTSIATQTITVVNNDHFNIATVSFPGPLEFINESCDMLDLTPAALNSFPTFTNTSCDVVLVSDPVDNVFYQVDSDNTCFKIIRTWTVVNHCTGDTRSEDQVIRVGNTIDPTIAVNSLDDEFNAIVCDGTDVSFQLTGNDDCDMGDITWTYQLDLYKDDAVTMLPQEALVPGNGAMINYSDFLPIGQHSITFTFTDKCNNSTSIVHDFVINDEVAPDPPACISATISLAPWEDENGDITIEGGCIIDVNTLIASSSHSCDDDLIVSFDPDDIVTEMCFFCEDIGINMVPVYVIDEDGDSNFCLAEITVEDTNDHQICSELDLALTKTLDEANSTLPATVGGDVTFLINIENQGTSVVTDISVVDYVPAGYIFNQADNTGWTYDAVTMMAFYDVTGLMLQPGTFLAPIPLVLEVSPNADANNLTNVAEIKSATDELGNSNDVDSSPDMTNDDTIGGNDVTDGTNDDEDDHDPETIPLFDLALIKTTTETGPYTLGQELTFDITVSNQGNEDVNNIEIVDYIPCGFTFANSSTGLTPAWTNNGNGTATATIPGTLAPGASTMISINLNLQNAEGTCTPDNAWINIAEISDFADPDGDFVDPNDFDSVDDNINDDTIGDDDVVNGENGDEDDHDPVEVMVFDLALDKALISTGAFEPGDVVEFVIAVGNQGNTDATNVVVTDYIQCGFAFDSGNANNSAWTQVGTNDPTTTIASLPAGAITTVSIFLEILPEDAACPEYKNIAEITSDEDGDIDSTPGNMDMAEDDIGMDILTLCPTAITTAPFTICADDAPVTLTATPTGGTWSGMGVDPVTGVFDPMGLSGDITITYTDDCEDMIVITVVEPLDVNLTTTATACNGTDYGTAPVSLNLFDFVDDDSGTWFLSVSMTPLSNTLAMSFSFDGQAPGDYEFLYIIEGTPPCDDFEGTLTVTVEDCTCPDIVITNPSPLCSDDAAVILTATPIGGTWSGTGVDPATGEFDPADAGAGTHDVSYTVENAACVETISITVVDPIALTITPNVVVCNSADNAGTTPTMLNLFDFVDNDSGTWSLGGVDLTNAEAMSVDFIDEPVGDQIFTYTITGTAPCGDTVGTLTVSVNDCDCPMITLTITGDDEICEGGSTTLTTAVTGATVTYLWSTGETTADITVSPAATTTYSLTITDVMSDVCTATQDFTVAVEILEAPLCPLDVDNATCEQFNDIDNFDSNFLTATPVSTDCGEVITSTFVFMAENCNDIDTLIRTFTVTNENGVTQTCTQTILTAEPCGTETPVELNCPELMQFAEDEDCDGGTIDIFDFFDFTSVPACCGEPEFTFTAAGASVIDSNMITFPDAGVYEITIDVMDDCGADACTFEVALADTLELRCNKIITFIDTDGITEFNPWDFILGGSEQGGVIDYGSIFGCDGDVQIPIDSASFDPMVLDTLLMVSCDSVEEVIEFNIYTWSPLGQDTCLAAFFLNDFPAPNNVCPNTLTDGGSIAGLISTEDDQSIENVAVALNGSGVDEEMTSSFGFYAFPSMPMGGNYVVSPLKDHDDLNGVSTLDLIKIQRHVLGIEVLDSPYKIIAADANASDDVSILDVLELRKLILGIYSELPQNTSWRMVDADHIFADPAQPFLFDLPESYPIQFLEDDMRIDFIGVKVGDVNGNANPASLQDNANAESRSGDVYGLTVHSDNKEGVHYASFGSEDSDLIYGMQMTLEYNRFELEIVDIIPNESLVDYFGAHIGDGYINISLSAPTAVLAEDISSFFEIAYQSNDEIGDNAFEISKDIITPEAYLENGIAELRLDEPTMMIEGLMTVSQNTPNPWSDQTVIDLNLSEDALVSFTVYSSDGKQVYATNEFKNAGNNKIVLRNVDLPSGGIFYYKVSAGSETVTKRFLLVK